MTPVMPGVSSVEFFVETWPPKGPQLEAEWRRVVEQGSFNPTLGPAWFSVIVAALAQSVRPVSILVGKEREKGVTAVLPFFVSSRRMLGLEMTVLEAGSNLMSYHAEVVTSGDPEEVIDAVFEAASGWDVFHMANVPFESPTARAIMRIARRRRLPLQVIQGDESPYLTIEGTWASYLATRNKKFRYKLRHRREQIEANKNCALRWVTSNAETDTLLKDILAIEEHSWKRGAGLNIGARESELTYHRLLLPYLAKEGALMANVLYHGERPIAYSLCCVFSGWVGHLKTSFDERFAELSPGGFVIDTCVERAFELQAREFDFLGDAAPHKLAWTKSTRRHVDLFVFGSTLKGRCIGWLKALKDRRARVPSTADHEPGA